MYFTLFELYSHILVNSTDSPSSASSGCILCRDGVVWTYGHFTENPYL